MELLYSKNQNGFFNGQVIVQSGALNTFFSKQKQQQQLRFKERDRNPDLFPWTNYVLMGAQHEKLIQTYYFSFPSLRHR